MTHAEKVNGNGEIGNILERFYRERHGGYIYDMKEAIERIDALYESKIKELEAEIARLNTIHSMMEDIRSGVKKGTVTIDREGFRILFAEEIGRLEAKIAVLEENQSGSLLKQFAYKSQQFIEAMDKINILEAKIARMDYLVSVARDCARWAKNPPASNEAALANIADLFHLGEALQQLDSELTDEKNN